MDDLAERLGLDPIALRLKNVPVEGDQRPDGRAWPVIGLKDCLEKVVAADWRTADSIVAITLNPDRLIAQVGVDGLALGDLPTTNLSPPLTALAVSAERPLLVTDQTGVWTFEQGLQDAWRQQLSGAGGAVPSYPG